MTGSHAGPLSRLVSILTSIGIVACSSATIVDRRVESIDLFFALGANGVTLGPRETAHLSVVSYDGAGNTITPGSPFSFASRDTRVVIASSSGLVTGVAGETTYIVATLKVDGRTFADSLLFSVGVATH
jgi:hypothetical protein